MLVYKTDNDLFTFPIRLRFKNKVKTLQGLVDTGSNICACSYIIPTTLKARPTSWDRVSDIYGKSKKTFGYSISVGFDGKSEMLKVYRLDLGIDGIDFILGAPILDFCDISIKQNVMNINWQRS